MGNLVEDRGGEVVGGGSGGEELAEVAGEGFGIAADGAILCC